MSAVRAHLWVESLSARELEVLRLISNGLSNREIAQELYLSIETVKWYNKQMFMKLGVRSRTQAVVKATELNLLNRDAGFPRAANAHLKRNLPVQLTSFIGREKEVNEIKSLLKDNRLVTLTGAGGSGKTRLANKVCEEVQDEYKDGAWLVELAKVREPSFVLQTIADTLNIVEGSDTASSEVLKRYLRRRQILLLIDNLEHLLESAPLISKLLAEAPNLSILGTSRERLQIYGEQEYPVRPLELPDLDYKGIDGDLTKVESVELLIRRARAFLPNLALDHETLKNIARICVNLDGLPLAIELCAPMVKVFPLAVIAERIERSLDTIPSGPHDLPARQKTLRDTIQWSYDLLDENEKRLFARLAVFNGGGTLQAIEKICGDGITDRIDNTLSALINKNLVLPQERLDGEIHFTMLDTIRQFGQDKLIESGDADQLADRHVEYFMKLTKRGAVALRGPDQIIWTDRFIVMHDNIRSGLEWVIESGEAETALRFTCDMYEFWLRNSDFEEARQWIKRVMALPDARLFRELYSEAFTYLSWITWLRGKISEALKMAEQALPLARSQLNKRNMAKALLNLGIMSVLYNHEFSKGQVYLEEARDLCQEINAEWELARSFMVLAVTHSQQARYSTANSLYSQALNLYTRLGDIGFQCIVLRLIGDLEVQQNNVQKGMEAYRDSLTIARAVKSNLQIAYNLWGLARAEKIKGNHLRTIPLYLACKNILEDIGAWSNRDDVEMDEEFTKARAALGDTRFQSAWEEGKHMSGEGAIEFALGSDGDLNNGS